MTNAASTPAQNPALDALKAISEATKTESKSAARREEVAERKAKKLTEKLEMLAEGKRTTPKGKVVTLNVRNTLVELVKTARLGATSEQLAATEVGARFNWAPLKEHVKTFVELTAGDLSTVVLAALYGEPSLVVGTPASAPQAPAPKARKPRKVAPKTDSK